MSTDKNRPWEAACVKGTSCQAKKRHRHPGRETQLSTPSAPPGWKEATHTSSKSTLCIVQTNQRHSQRRKKERLKQTGNSIFRSAGGKEEIQQVQATFSATLFCLSLHLETLCVIRITTFTMCKCVKRQNKIRPRGEQDYWRGLQSGAGSADDRNHGRQDHLLYQRTRSSRWSLTWRAIVF